VEADTRLTARITIGNPLLSTHADPVEPRARDDGGRLAGPAGRLQHVVDGFAKIVDPHAEGRLGGVRLDTGPFAPTVVVRARAGGRFDDLDLELVARAGMG
jgi:hypothetical protein